MTVSIEKSDDIWTIIHDRPEARNAMDPESADALVAAFEEFDKSAAKVGVLWRIVVVVGLYIYDASIVRWFF